MNSLILCVYCKESIRNTKGRHTAELIKNTCSVYPMTVSLLSGSRRPQKNIRLNVGAS